MIEYGSDYLLGLASFAPEKFAERDRLWEAGDPAYYALSDASAVSGQRGLSPAGSGLQALRGGVPAFDRTNSHRPGASQESKTSRLGSWKYCATVRAGWVVGDFRAFFTRYRGRAAIARRPIDRLDQGDTSPSLTPVADRSCVLLNGLKKIFKQRLMPAKVADHRR